MTYIGINGFAMVTRKYHNKHGLTTFSEIEVHTLKKSNLGHKSYIRQSIFYSTLLGALLS